MSPVRSHFLSSPRPLLCLLMALTFLSSAIGSLAASQFAPNNRCECVFSGHIGGVNEGVLDLLKSQLDRCGPEHLAAPIACGAVGYSGSAVVGAFVVGITSALAGVTFLVYGCRTKVVVDAVAETPRLRRLRIANAAESR